MAIYNKLVRDNIPQMIQESGKQPVVEVLEGKEYLDALNRKLQEELNEYYEDGSINELADLVQVVQAILNYKEVPLHKFDEIMESKTKKRGGFDQRLFLKEVIE